MKLKKAINIIKNNKVDIYDLVFLYDEIFMGNESLSYEKKSDITQNGDSEHTLFLQHKTQEANKVSNWITFQIYSFDNSSDRVMTLTVEEKKINYNSIRASELYDTKRLLYFSFLKSQYMGVNLKHDIEFPKFEYHVYDKYELIKFIKILDLGKGFKIKRTISSYS